MKESAFRSLLRRRSQKLRLHPECTGFETFRHTCATWVREEGDSNDDIHIVLSDMPMDSTAARWYTVQAQMVEPKRKLLLKVEARHLRAMERVTGVKMDPC